MENAGAPNLLETQVGKALVRGDSLVKGLENEIELKAQLFAEGVRVGEEALEGVPERYYPAFTD